MELTPQSRSPTSPFRYTSNSQPLYEYPSPAQSDSRYRSTDSLQGLGLYSCPMSGSTVEERGSVTTESSSATHNWPTTGTLQHRQSTPNILSAEFDPFASSFPSFPSGRPSNHDIYSAQTTASSRTFEHYISTLIFLFCSRIRGLHPSWICSFLHPTHQDGRSHRLCHWRRRHDNELTSTEP